MTGQHNTANSIAEIFGNKSPTFQKLKNDGLAKGLLEFIVEETIRFIQLNFPSTQHTTLIASEFANDLLEFKSDWKADDIRLFYKFIKSNQGYIEEIKVFGNIITPLKLLELTSFYELQKASEREKHVAEHKVNDRFLIEQAHEPHVKKYINWIKDNFEKALQEEKEKKKPEITGVKHNAFDPIKNSDHFKQFIQLSEYFKPEEKEKWRKSITNFDSLDQEEQKRKTELLKILV